MAAMVWLYSAVSDYGNITLLSDSNGLVNCNTLHTSAKEHDDFNIFYVLCPVKNIPRTHALRT